MFPGLRKQTDSTEYVCSAMRTCVHSFICGNEEKMTTYLVRALAVRRRSGLTLSDQLRSAPWKSANEPRQATQSYNASNQ
jgi:hypothetical protein